MTRAEGFVLGGIVALGLAFFPAFRDVALVQSIAIALCGGLLP